MVLDHISVWVSKSIAGRGVPSCTPQQHVYDPSKLDADTPTIWACPADMVSCYGYVGVLRVVLLHLAGHVQFQPQPGKQALLQIVLLPYLVRRAQTDLQRYNSFRTSLTLELSCSLGASVILLAFGCFLYHYRVFIILRRRVINYSTAIDKIIDRNVKKWTNRHKSRI